MENKDSLFEGYDFIEESAPFSVEPLEFEDTSELDISESANNGSKFKIIGKVKGCMAPIGVYSRNHRIYEDTHWKKVLSNPLLQERLASRRLFGMPSHMQKKIDDEDFREGRISHIVSCLEVREDNNGKPFLYGEFDILDTPAGRILKAMYEGGAGIYVSTRAAGKLEPIMGDPINKRVNSDSYYLDSIDCVLNPGFLQARPTFEAVSVEQTPQPTLQEKQIKESQEQSKPNFSASISEATLQPTVATNEEVEVLKEQIDKLAKVLEKVVDDVYEAEEEQIEEGRKPGESDEEMKDRLHKELVNKIEAGAEKKEKEGKFTEEERKKVHDKLDKLDDIKPVAFCGESSKAALIGALGLLSSSNISEGLFEQIVDMIKKSKEEKDK